MKLVHVLNHCVQVSVIPSSSLVLEIITKETEDFIRHVMLRTLIQMIKQILGAFSRIAIL
jgi:hypothetical protein